MQVFKVGHTMSGLVAGVALSGIFSGNALAADAVQAKEAVNKPMMADLIKASKPGDWRPLDLQNTLYLDLPQGRVVIELAPNFAPNHVNNIKALVRENYFDGLVILRSQDNYVVQWGDPTEKKEIKTAKKALAEEFTVNYAASLPFTRLPDADGYASQVGHANGMPAGRDPKTGRAWLAHCYGMVGAGRDTASDSGGGTELYVVTGHAPRQLDRNVTLVGRVMQGMELLSSLPRGTGALGFYEKPEQQVPIKSIRIAADVPAADRTNLEVIRTDTPTFTAIVEAQRNRGGDWYKYAAGYIELCNVPIVVRAQK
ncbi:peptidylprolyl isomerase [Undibacterium terreum]|uniref:peptidylprolyl isomerase n=1 Tax=Undibacterium terreum TaxID=1224302 RepID=A0A916UFV1_9BURK|nr:peptidylprolyl isomerase [Undibacterium terreum]GGC71461.1 peptidyl-prolyl cis-trans isomerase [Undibacterium terreum]